MFFNDEEETAEGSEAETTEVPTEGAEEVPRDRARHDGPAPWAHEGR